MGKFFTIFIVSKLIVTTLKDNGNRHLASHIISTAKSFSSSLALCVAIVLINQRIVVEDIPTSINYKHIIYVDFNKNKNNDTHDDKNIILLIALGTIKMLNKLLFNFRMIDIYTYLMIIVKVTCLHG